MSRTGSSGEEPSKSAAAIAQAKRREKKKAIDAQRVREIETLRERVSSLESKQRRYLKMEEDMSSYFAAGVAAGEEGLKVKFEHIQQELADSQRRESLLEQELDAEAVNETMETPAPKGFSGYVRYWRNETCQDLQFSPLANTSSHPLTQTARPEFLEAETVPALIELYYLTHAPLPEGIHLEAPHPKYSPLHIYIDLDCSHLYKTTYQAIVLLDLTAFLLKCGCVLFIVQGREHLIDHSSFAALDGSESVLLTGDRWHLQHVPPPGTTGPRHVHQAGEPEPYLGLIFQKVWDDQPDELENPPTIKEFLSDTSFPQRPPAIDAGDEGMLVDIEQAYHYFSDPGLLFPSGKASPPESHHPDWSSAQWSYPFFDFSNRSYASSKLSFPGTSFILTNPIKLEHFDSISFPPYTSRTDHPDKPCQPGFTHGYIYASAHEKVAFEFHVEDFEASSVNTSIWTGRSLKEEESMAVDEGANYKDSAKIWIVVSALYRARVEAGIESKPASLSSHCVKLIYSVGSSEILPKDPHPKHSHSCNQRFRDTALIPTPQFLEHLGIPFYLIVQRAGMTVHVGPAAYHGGYNTGPSINWAINVEGPGLTGTGCQCPDSEDKASVHTILT
ncbi:hypothetical protein P7C70_g8626, partial [Phenoliferia sp. Uapishka_3]